MEFKAWSDERRFPPILLRFGGWDLAVGPHAHRVQLPLPGRPDMCISEDSPVSTIAPELTYVAGTNSYQYGNGSCGSPPAFTHPRNPTRSAPQ